MSEEAGNEWETSVIVNGLGIKSTPDETAIMKVNRKKRELRIMWNESVYKNAGSITKIAEIVGEQIRDANKEVVQ